MTRDGGTEYWAPSLRGPLVLEATLHSISSIAVEGDKWPGWTFPAFHERPLCEAEWRCNCPHRLTNY